MRITFHKALRPSKYYFLLPSTILITIAVTAISISWPWYGLALVAASILAVGSLYLLRHPWTAFYAYLFLLAPHVLLMAILLVVVGLPANIVKVISAWKEAVLLLLLFGVLLRFVQRSRFVLSLPDFLIVFYTGYVVIAALFALYHKTPLIALAYGVRDALLPMLVYFVGRSLSFDEGTAQRIFRMVLIATALFSGLGIIERFFVPIEWHVAVGIPRYFRELLGTPYPEWLLGLPYNYWTSANSGSIRRAVSVYGSSQGLATAFLFLFPFCIYGLLKRSLAEHRFATITFVLAIIALTLTFTRFTIVVCLFLLFLAGILGNRRARNIVAISVVIVGVAFIGIFVVSSDVRLLIINTITFEDHSSSRRLVVWADALRQIVEQPFGSGIGVVGQTSFRFETRVLNIEGQYSKVGVELGIVGLLIYISILAATSMYLMRAAYRTKASYHHALFFALSLCFIGLAMNAATTEWHNAPALVYPAWWLAGTCVAHAARQATTLKKSSPDTRELPKL